jgi:hypothetical protein
MAVIGIESGSSIDKRGALLSALFFVIKKHADFADERR